MSRGGMDFGGNGNDPRPQVWSRRVRDFGRAALALADDLLEESARAAAEEPGTAEELAGLAVLVAGLPQPREEAGRVEAAKARGWCLLGGARRLRGDLAGAAEALRRAEPHLAPEAESPGRAFYGWQLALLRHEQGKVEEAVAGLSRAAGIYGAAGDPDGEGSCLAALGALLLEEGEHERAVAPLIRAGELLDPDRDLCLAARVRLGLALCHAALGYPGRALRDAGEAWELGRGVTDPLERAALCSLRARIEELVK